MTTRILQKLGEAKDSVELVRSNLPDSFEQFEAMHRLERDGIYKNIEFTIQNLLDICALICTEEKLDVPAEDYDMIEELKHHGIITADDADTLTVMKGFRNHLVHRYGKIDERRAFHDIHEGLDDFPDLFTTFRNYAEQSA